MPPPQKIRLYPFRHRQQDVVVASFEYDASLVDMIKQLPGACWSRTLKSWSFPKNIFDLHRFFEAFKKVAYTDYSALKQENRMRAGSALDRVKATYDLKMIKVQLSPNVKAQVQSFKKWMEQKRYAENSIKTYIHQLEIFFRVLCIQKSRVDQQWRYYPFQHRIYPGTRIKCDFSKPDGERTKTILRKQIQTDVEH